MNSLFSSLIFSAFIYSLLTCISWGWKMEALDNSLNRQIQLCKNYLFFFYMYLWHNFFYIMNMCFYEVHRWLARHSACIEKCDIMTQQGFIGVHLYVNIWVLSILSIYYTYLQLVLSYKCNVISITSIFQWKIQYCKQWTIWLVFTCAMHHLKNLWHFHILFLLKIKFRIFSYNQTVLHFCR